jgi:hypothetical protein
MLRLISSKGHLSVQWIDEYVRHELKVSDHVLEKIRKINLNEVYQNKTIDCGEELHISWRDHLVKNGVNVISFQSRSEEYVNPNLRSNELPAI